MVFEGSETFSLTSPLLQGKGMDDGETVSFSPCFDPNLVGSKRVASYNKGSKVVRESNPPTLE